MKPRILMLIDRPGWAYDICAHGLSRQLGDHYVFEFAYVCEKPRIDPGRYDLIYVYFWGEDYLNRFDPDPDRVIKEISSHRWADHDAFGRCSPAEMVEAYLGDASTRIATSRRLFDLLSPHAERLFLCPNGYREDLFGPHGVRSGPLSIGWVGDPRDEAKRFAEIIEPLIAAGRPIRIASGDRSHEELVDFYDALDVVCISSETEGTPLPLLEAMASGCYPVCTDVGVVSEIIEHQENGLIVEGRPAAFEDGLEWCRRNLERIRQAGLENAERIRRTRSWSVVADGFHRVFENTLAWAPLPETGLVPGHGSRPDAPEPILQHGATGRSEFETALSLHYDVHYQRLNPNTDRAAVHRDHLAYLWEDVIPCLPSDRQSRCLEIGIGNGHLLQYLVEQRYAAVTGIDNCPALIENAARHLGERVDLACVADTADYLEEHPETFDCICMIDVLEHFTFDEGHRILREARRALRSGGRILLRTPNMANLLGAYSRWIDLTHKSAYTEWSLNEMLEVAGFTDVQIHEPSRFGTPKRALMNLVNRKLHRFVYWLHDRKMPNTFSKNLMATAKRGDSFLKPTYP
jgi:glycosyltransferase involved in cell wall biosynthesis/2-polyprenyl-3-methyl-5-hydroxy-6-metoxy-1,4-benzoquinol methylase